MELHPIILNILNFDNPSYPPPPPGIFYATELPCTTEVNLGRGRGIEKSSAIWTGIFLWCRWHISWLSFQISPLAHLESAVLTSFSWCYWTTFCMILLNNNNSLFYLLSILLHVFKKFRDRGLDCKFWCNSILNMFLHQMSPQWQRVLEHTTRSRYLRCYDNDACKLPISSMEHPPLGSWENESLCQRSQSSYGLERANQNTKKWCDTAHVGWCHSATIVIRTTRAPDAGLKWSLQARASEE